MNYLEKYMKFGIDSITTYTLFPQSREKCVVQKTSLKNLEKKYTSPILSHSSAKKIKSILANWILAINMSQADQKNKYQKKRRYLVMLTLTLPSAQVHTDNEIKRDFLNNFLQSLKRKHPTIHYLWVAEKQKNGNIHFHIMLDRFVHFLEAQRMWNKVLSNGPYIQAFREKFNHSNPPSVKLTGQKKMENPAAYLTKYVTKAESSQPIQGHKWSCSDELLLIINIKLPFKAWYAEYLYYYRKEFNCKYFSNDFVEVYYFEGNFLKDLLYIELFALNETTIRFTFSKLFPELKKKIECPAGTSVIKSPTFEQQVLAF